MIFIFIFYILDIMKRLFFISLVFTSLIFSDSRVTIFNTGSPDSLDYGYDINSSQSVANRFYVSNDYILEAMGFYVTLESGPGLINISIREDANGVPGNIVDETAQWNYQLNALSNNGYNIIVTTDQCIYLNSNEYYWLTIGTNDMNTEALWVYSNNSNYTYSTSENDIWVTRNGNAGAGAIFAEQVYELPYPEGDVNFDFVTNVVDIVNLVGHVLETSILSNEALAYADVNNDGIINVIDVVSLINRILQDSNPNPNFLLEDINPASQYYSESIGPSFFNGQVSCYYFGKQG